MVEPNTESLKPREEAAGSVQGQGLGASNPAWRSGIEEVFNTSYTPTNLIAELKKHPRVAFLYEQDSRIPEKYTIEEHTEMVLGQFERYLVNAPMPSGITKDELRLMLALHDIGKSIPLNKDDQHRATIEVIESLRADLPISESGWAIGRLLIDNDLIGLTIRAGTAQLATMSERKAIGERAKVEAIPVADMQSFVDLVKFKPFPGDVQSATEWQDRFEKGAQFIANESAALGLKPTELMNLMVLFYQTDTAAYSYDAQTAGGRRASPGLDFLYSLNPDFELGRNNNLLVSNKSTGLLTFSPAVTQIVAGLEDAVRKLEVPLH
jgi:hypothetical protein